MALSISQLPSLLLSRILSILLVLTLSALHLYIHQVLVPITSLSFNLKRILPPYYEVYRMMTSQWVHASIWHIGFNVFALLSYSFLEQQEGKLFFLGLNFLLLCGCASLQFIMYYILWKRYQLERFRDLHAVGYSCVLFGLMTYASMKDPLSFVYIMGFLPLPSLLVPFMSLLLTQLIVPRASFLGHLTGILVAYPLSIPAFTEWINLWWLITSILLVTAVLVVNVKAINPNLRLLRRWIQVEWLNTGTSGSSSNSEDSIADLEIGESENTIVNGRLMSRSEAQQQEQEVRHAAQSGANTTVEEDEDAELAAAIAASLEDEHRIDISSGDSPMDSSENVVVDLPPREDDTSISGREGDRLLNRGGSDDDETEDLFDNAP